MGGGDEFLMNSTFLVAQRGKGVIIQVFTALSCLSSADPERFMHRFMVVCSRFHSENTVVCKWTRFFGGEIICFLRVSSCFPREAFEPAHF